MSHGGVNGAPKTVRNDTQSVAEASVVPSTPGQLVLAKEMAEELRALGLKDVEVTEHAYVTATLPGNSLKKVPAISSAPFAVFSRIVRGRAFRRSY